MNPKQTKTENQRVKLSPEKQLEILSRGAKIIGHNRDAKAVVHNEFLEKLKANRPLKVKAGFDPSRPDLHLGHSLLINKLRQFQELGHQVIFVVGDWTACIGDPSGQNKTRPALTFEESRQNAKTYKKQACKKNFTFRSRHSSRNGHPAELSIQPDFNKDSEKIFNFFKRLDPKQTEIVFNSKWFNRLSLREFILNIASQSTLARQLERDDFKKRFGNNQPIALHELFYPLLQAYDSVELKADVEIGGTDQLFNLLLGRQLQETFGQSPQIILTLPLLEGLGAKSDSYSLKENCNMEGADKMSKSLGNAISFNDSPKDMYGKIMSLSDKLLVRWWNLFTDWGEENKINPFDSDYNNFKAKKEELAWLLVCSFYGESKANKEKETFKKERTEKRIPEDIPEDQDKKQDISLVDLLLKLNLVSSKSEARRKILEGAVRILEDFNTILDIKPAKQKINDSISISRNQMEKIMKPDKILSIQVNQEIIVSVGKRNFGRFNTWDYIHDLKVLDLYKREGQIKKKLCEELSEDEDFKKADIPLRSIIKKLDNYEYLNKGKGLSHVSKQNREIFQEYKDYTISEIEEEIKKIKNKEKIPKENSKNSKWKYMHDLKALKLYKKIKKETKEIKEKLCEELSNDEDFKKANISLKSIKMKIANYRYLDNKGGLSHVSKQSKEIYKKYKGYSIAKLEEEIKRLETEKPNKGKG